MFLRCQPRTLVVFRPGGGNLLRRIRQGMHLTPAECMDLGEGAAKGEYLVADVSDLVGERDLECVSALRERCARRCGARAAPARKNMVS